MKLALLPLLLFFACCAPKATIVEEAPNPATKTEVKAEDPDDLKLPPKDNLGLLDPPRLTSMPTPKDMKSTTDSSGSGGGTVITTPGEEKKPPSE